MKPIKIKPENKGKLHKALGVPKDEEIPEEKLEKAKKKAKKTGNTKLEKEVVFAENAKSWNHKSGFKPKKY